MTQKSCLLGKDYFVTDSLYSKMSLQALSLAERTQKQYLVGNRCPPVPFWTVITVVPVYKSIFWQSMSVQLELWELPDYLCTWIIVQPWASPVSTLDLVSQHWNLYSDCPHAHTGLSVTLIQWLILLSFFMPSSARSHINFSEIANCNKGFNG